MTFFFSSLTFVYLKVGARFFPTVRLEVQLSWLVRFFAQFVHVKHEVIAGGRCHCIHLRGRKGCMTVINMHIDPALSNGMKYGLIRQVAFRVKPVDKYATWIL
eukprot:4269524-Pyramimonas_sp.AAC.1